MHFTTPQERAEQVQAMHTQRNLNAMFHIHIGMAILAVASAAMAIAPYVH